MSLDFSFMKMIPILSGNIIYIGYDENSKKLRVKLKSSMYEYNNVPKHVYINFLSEKSKVKFFHSNIRHRFKPYKIY